MTDQWMTAKVRVSRGAEGHLGLLGGVKLPFGDDDETGEAEDANAPLDPPSSRGAGPSTGCWASPTRDGSPSG
jgi:hypothetical protein